MKKIILPLVLIAASATFAWSQFGRLDAGNAAGVQTQSASVGPLSATPANSASLVSKPKITVAAAMVAASPSQGQYKDGSYQGVASDAFYGLVQVEADVKNGQLVTVKILQYPRDRNTSRSINSEAIPLLNQEAIQAQSGQVDFVTGATLTSGAYVQSLTDALSQASASGSLTQAST